jgi:uncharacterized repeat protein (TIGR01451 family)
MSEQVENPISSKSSKTSKSHKSSKLNKTIDKFIKFVKKRPLYFLGALAIVTGSLTLIGASAAKGDCGDNSIVRCGAFNASTGAGPSQVQFNSNVSRYHDGNEVDRIFDYYGIDDRSLGSLPLGEVRIDGTIWVGGKKVATNAKSTGRQNISNANGTSKEVRIPGGPTIYEREPKVSFRQNSLQAWVKLDSNGKFLYAVITSCGNPTTGTPTYVPTEPPKVTGELKCTSITATKIDRTRFRFNVTASKSGSAKITKFIIGYSSTESDVLQTSAGSATFTKEFSKPGKYVVQSAVLGMVGQTGVTGSGTQCNTTVNIEPVVEQPKTPAFTIKKYVNGSDAQTNNDSVGVRANEEFEYKVVVTNTGEVKLSNVRVWDVLPSGVTYVDNTLRLGGSLVSNDSDFFNVTKGVVVPSIEVGGSVEFTLKAVIKTMEDDIAEKCSQEGKFYNNVAKADPEGTETGLDEKSDPAVIKCVEIPVVDRPAVSIEKGVSKYEVSVNEEFVWIIKVTNNGNIDLNNVKVTDIAPEGVEFVAAVEKPGAQTKVTNGKAYEATIAKLKVGEDQRLEIKSRVTRQVSGELVNTACVDAVEVTDQGSDSNKDDCDDAKVRVPEERCPVVGKENLPKDSTECRAEPCPYPGLENYDASNVLCKTVIAQTPEQTPSTGNEIAVMAAVALAIGGGVYAYTMKGFKKA